ncbi:MAG: PQQ-like beta-propeller repeat protein [Planctomycetales bacterium]|nr:PQQ-like beta-propeller repeat protein [Planctomycetales bacterium]
MKRKIVITGLLLCGIWAVAAGVKPVSEYAAQSTDPLVSHDLLRQAGWSSNWQMNLPLKTGEAVARMGVAGPNLFVITNTNVMFCLDRVQGRLRYTRPLSARNLPVRTPLYYEEKFWFIIGSEMLVFDPAGGDFTIRQKFEGFGGASCLALNDTHVFIAGSDNRLHAVNRDGYWQEFLASADNDAPIVSVLAAADVVVFATDAGNIVGMAPTEARKQWQFDATGQIHVPLVQDGGDVYAGSRDTKLYKINLTSGRLAWASPYSSGGPIQKPFTVGQKVVYLHNALSGLCGVSKETGKAVWTAPAGVGMICETPDKGFIFAVPGILKVMDNTTGRELYSVNFAQVESYAVNTTDAVMYVGDANGRLMSIAAR